MRLRRIMSAIFAVAIALSPSVPRSAVAADPASGSVGAADPSVSWTGPDVSAETSGPEACEEQSGALFPPFCDDFSLSVTDPGELTVFVTGTVPANDFDLYVYDNTGTLVGSSALPASLEATSIACATPAGSPYLVRSVYFTTVATPLAGDPGYSGEAAWAPPEAGACDAAPDTQAVFGGTLSFAPASIVSAHFLGSEPQTTLERTVPGAAPNAGIDPDRIFVDWPLSSRSAIGQLSRSIDGGDSFRLLLDLLCAPRSRPNCATGGGGDTEEDVNLHTGSVYFSDQEVVVNEAFAASFDHGDSWINQTPLASQATATDRQWIAVADDELLVPKVAALVPVEAFLTYHVPCEGQYIHGIERLGNQGQPLPQPVSQIVNVGQSGQPRVDTNETSPGYHWIYQPYHTCIGINENAGSLTMGSAFAPDYASPLAWKSNFVDTDTPDIFSWSAIDAAGNAYLVWSTNGVMYISVAPMTDPGNDPGQGGWPGSHWTPKVRVQLPEIGTAVFPQVIAGPPGVPGTVAISYDGTTDHVGMPDSAPDGAIWHTYAAVVSYPNGFDAAPVVNTGRVSHRPIHRGNVCTGGTGCTGSFDRSLLDMIDVGFDDGGRLGVVFTDNYSQRFHEGGPGAVDESPFVHFAKQLSGPSMLGETLRVRAPSGDCRADAAADATWQNKASGANLPALDIRQACVTVKKGQVTATITLSQASAAAMARDLTAYNTASQPCLEPCSGHRLQYVMRFLTDTDIYHLSAEFVPSGGLRFFGGVLDANDKLPNPANPIDAIAAGYHTDAGFAVTGQLQGTTLTLHTSAAALGLTNGGKVYSATAFAMAGPLEAEELTAAYTMRTVDASPPFDKSVARQR
jgi:hypothetical protein